MKVKYYTMALLFCSVSVLSSPIDIIGVVGQAQCNKIAGTGVAEIKTNVDNVLISTWYKVKSTKLCGDIKENALWINSPTKLSSIAADNTISTNLLLNKLILNKEGFLIDLENAGNINAMSFMKDIKSFKRVNVESAHNWFFKI